MDKRYHCSIRRLTSCIIALGFLLITGSLSAQNVYKDYVDGRIYFQIRSGQPIMGESDAEHGPKDVDIDEVKYLDGLRDDHEFTLLRRPFHYVDKDKGDELIRTYELRFKDAQNVDEIIGELENVAGVTYAEKVPLNEAVYSPNDPYYTGNNQWFLPKINAANAWDYSFGSSNIVVAVTDNAIDTTHQDLKQTIWENTDEIPNNGVDDDGNGYIDDRHGYDVADDDPDPLPASSSTRHGTHVSGLAGGITDNSTGIASIGFGVSIMAVKVSPDNSPYLTAGYDGITYAAENGADVINMSWGSSSSSSTGQNVIDFAHNQGAVLVAAAGNDDVSTTFYPAGYQYVMSVAATDQNDSKASFSNYGSWVDISAPGVSMASTVPGNNYDYLQGTSMASPVVAGLAGLMLSYNPNLSISEVENCITSTADDISSQNPSYTGQLGAGRINAEQAMACVSATVSNAADDAGITQVLVPQGDLCGTTFSPEVVLKNYGSNDLTSVDINYQIDGGPVNTQSWTGTLTQNSTTTVTLPSQTVATGSHTFTSYTSNPNGVNDTVNSNDTTMTNFNAIDGNSLTLSIDLDCYPGETGWELRNSSNGAIVDSVGSGSYNNGNTTVTHNFCVPDGCYEFEITDTYGDGLAGANTGNCSSNGDYQLVNDSTGTVLVDMGSDPNWGSDTTHSFCVPQTTGPPNADFTANQTTIPVGGTVDFTDLSTGNPNPNSWSWTFNGGTPNSSTNQNPSGIQYNTAGTYDVSLTVDNGNGTDTETKTNYIEVVQSNGDCDTIDNILANDTLTYYQLSGAWGYLPGHNEYTLTQYADSMYAASGAYVNAAWVPIGKAYSGTALSSINVKIWDDNGGVPGNVLTSETVQISDLTAASYNKVYFGSPAWVNGAFYIGVELNYGNGDTVTVYTAQDRGAGNLASAYYYDGTSWTSFESGVGIYSSLGIYALLSSGQPSATFNIQDNNICLGDSAQVDGSSSVNVNDWLWISPGGNPDTSTGQTSTIGYGSKGTYDIKLYAFGGCMIDSMTKQVSVNAPEIDSVDVSDATCGNNDGSIDITASAGFAPYEYSNDGGSTFQISNSFTGLAAGNYNVVVKDDEGCTVSQTVTVDQPSGPTIDSVQVTDATCGNNDGSFTIHTSSGAYPLQFSNDDGSTFQSDSTFSNLGSGTYNLVVKDANGCEAFDTVDVNTSNGPNITSVDTIGVTCNGGSDGSITINASGATEYSIDGGSTFQASNSFNGLTAGTYNVVVQDNNGCQDQTTATITEPNAVSFNTSVTDESCGNNDGSITINASGGDGNYQYSNDNGANFQGSNTFSGLSQGTYDIVVEDGNGCSASSSVTVGGTPGVSASVTTNDESCQNSNGSASASVSSGTSPYTYNWSNGGSGSSISGLSAGNYYVIVQDANGCTDSVAFTIYNNGSVTATATPSSTTICEGDNITLSASGGVSYSWEDQNGNNIGTSSSVTVSPTSTMEYYVTVTGSNGCTDVDTSVVNVNTIPNTQVTNDTTICNGDSITLTASGGSSYNWNTGETTQSITVAPSSTTTYYVVASNGSCSDSSPASVTVTVDAAAVAVAGANDTVVYLSQGATVDFTSNGSTASSYYWDFDDGNQSTAANPTYSYGATGTYQVVLKASLGNCIDTDTITIVVKENVGIASKDEDGQRFNLYPNPTDGNLNIDVSLSERKDVTIRIFNAMGKVVETIDEKNMSRNTFQVDLGGRAEGMYFVRIITDENVTTKKVNVVR